MSFSIVFLYYIHTYCMHTVQYMVGVMLIYFFFFFHPAGGKGKEEEEEEEKMR